MTPLVSVIIPVYNMERYLGKCMDSVLRQTYGNIEILLINDGSTDGSGRICDEYAERDKRIVVKHQPNSGASASRNKGIDLASGEYLAFVDSDDYILPNMIEKLVALCSRFNADIAICEIYENEPDIYENSDQSIKVMRNDEFMPLILRDVIPAYMCNKLFRAELFEGIRFPLNIMVGDMVIAHHIFNAANQIVQTNEKLYVYYSKRPNNMSHNRDNWVALSYDRAIVFKDRYEFARVYYPSICNELLKQMVHFYASTYVKMLIEKNDYSKEMKEIRGDIEKYRDAVKHASNVSVLKKLTFICIVRIWHVPLIFMARLYMLFKKQY